MKFFAPLFAASAVAYSFGSPVEKRQASVVTGAIASISSATSALNTAVQGFNGAGQVASLQAASDAVLSAINAGQAAVSPIAVLSTNDATGLAGPLGDLATLVTSTVNNVIAKKATFVSAGAGSAVYSSLVAQQSAAQSFSTTALSKVPDALQQIGKNLAQPITDSLAKGVSAFADQASGGSTTGGAAPTSTAGPTSTAPTSSNASMTAASYTAGPVTVKPTASATYQVWSSTTGGITKYTGAAVVNAANSFGAAAVAALAAAAML